MEDLGPVIDWLNQPSSDWIEPFAPPTEPPQVRHSPPRETISGALPSDNDLELSKWLCDADLPREDDWLAIPDNHDLKVQSEVEALKREVERRLDQMERLLESNERTERRLVQLERQTLGMLKWSAEVSAAFNDMQLKQEGLSPLQKHFGSVLGVRLRKGA